MSTSGLLPIRLLALASLSFLGLTSLEAEETFPTTGSVERLEPALDKLIAPGTKIEVLAEGFTWSEGPIWIKDGNYVVFSDVPENRVHKWKEGEGLSTYLAPSGFTGGEREGESGSNGLTLDAKGNLILCQHGDRRVARMAAPLDKPEAKFETIAGDFQGKKFNSPNDLAFASDGTLFFTDPPYGMVKKAEDPNREIDFCGVYRMKPGGPVELVDNSLPRPNGIALSHDEKTLYVAQSHGPAPIYKAYPISEDGSVGEGKVLFDASHLAKERPGMPDGIKVDVHGNIWGTGPGGVLIISPEGKHLGSILTGERTANCAFGGPDGSTLYMTADGFLMRIKTNTKGATL